MPDQHTTTSNVAPDASEGDVLEQMTPASEVDEEGNVTEATPQLDLHDGLVNEADLIEQAAPVEGDEDDYRDGD